MGNNSLISFLVATGKQDNLNDIKQLVHGFSEITRIYGIILYTDRDPNVKKVLRDEDYWNSLDVKSGDRWPIFAIRPKTQAECRHKRLPSNAMYEMIPIDGDPVDNALFLSDFGIEDYKQLPLFIAFMWDDEGVLRQVNVPIEGNDVPTVYKSLEHIIDTISETEKNIDPENKGSVNVFREVKSSLDALKFKNKALKTFEIVKTIRDILGLFSKS